LMRLQAIANTMKVFICQNRALEAGVGLASAWFFGWSTGLVLDIRAQYIVKRRNVQGRSHKKAPNKNGLIPLYDQGMPDLFGRIADCLRGPSGCCMSENSNVYLHGRYYLIPI